MAGGVSGIGAATAELLKSSGYTVIANYFGNDAGITRGISLMNPLIFPDSKTPDFEIPRSC